MQYVYMVQLDWSTTDDEDLEIYIYRNFEDAYNKFTSLIEDEINPDIGWIGESVFDENGDTNDDYLPPPRRSSETECFIYTR